MPTQESLTQIETGELIQSVDDGRLAGDPFKLPAALRTLVDTRLAELKAKDSATLTSEGGRAGATAATRAALDTLKDLLRDGYHHINGIGSYAISKPDKLALFISYGWESGEIGVFDDPRIEWLANQAVTVTPTISNPAHRYPTALMDLITAQLAIVNANQPAATGGSARLATAARDAALKLLTTANDRTRFYYCSASDEEDEHYGRFALTPDVYGDLRPRFQSLEQAFLRQIHSHDNATQPV